MRCWLSTREDYTHDDDAQLLFNVHLILEENVAGSANASFR